MPDEPFVTLGREKGSIEVRISYRIIQLFSEGLYASPHKAIEELVSNAFDAGARNVHVILPMDLHAKDASIAVVDDGESMDEKKLRRHWLIGVSDKRALNRSPRQRKQIGRFGIGKLATYVLAQQLTHICRARGKYYATTMDYSRIPAGEDRGVFDKKKVALPLRVLSEADAREAVSPFMRGSTPGHSTIRLFGKGAPTSWTVAIMSRLKPMAVEIKQGTLAWVLRTAMPLRDDFRLYLNGKQQTPSKAAGKRIRRWVLGKDLLELPRPAPDGIQAGRCPDRVPPDEKHGIIVPELGYVSGYIELFEDPLVGSKSDEIERSNGFFVYVRGRLINMHDPGFGINRNLLRHGTFSRFRAAVHIDILDDELRSSRESVRHSSPYIAAKNLLHGMFNFARTQHEKHEAALTPGAQVAERFAATPGSLTRRPLLALVRAVLEGKATPRYTLCPRSLGPTEQEQFLDSLQDRASGKEGLIVDCQIVERSPTDGIALFDSETGTLQINAFHPFVGYFLDEYENRAVSQPLLLLAMSEVLTEAHLYYLRIGEKQIRDILAHRDELLRHLVRASGTRTALAVSMALADAKSDKDRLETEIVAAFEMMSFEASHLGGPGKPDGVADAPLAASPDGQRRCYRVTLEAKSKEDPNSKVPSHGVNVSAVARHRDDHKADHAIVVGPDFPTTRGEEAALVKEIREDRKKNAQAGKTITPMRIDDLARLVRLVPLKRIGLDRIRELFRDCATPEEAKAWVDGIAALSPKKWPYEQILKAIWQTQKQVPGEAVEYAAVKTNLLHPPFRIEIAKSDVVGCCRALYRIAPTLVEARETTVELNRSPSDILRDMRAALRDYPQEDTQKASISL